MHVLEILNAYPGETFIQEHGRVLAQDDRFDVSWAFWQVSKSHQLDRPVAGLRSCIGLFNSNRSSSWMKARVKATYLNKSSAYLEYVIDQIREIQPDVLHFHFAPLAIQHHQLSDRLGVPFTFSIRGSDIHTMPTTIPGYLDKLQREVERAAGIHVVSEGLKDVACDYFGHNSKFRLIRTVVSREWKSVGRRAIKGKLVVVGRLHWCKGLSDLILACHLLRTRGHSFELAIVGEGEERPMLDYMIRDLGLGDIVKLKGRLNHDEIRELFEEAELLVLPSLREGFPNVAVEAMLARLPVMASTDAGVQEVFDPDSEFLLVQTGDPESIASGIVRFFNVGDKDKASMTQSAYCTADETFSSESHADGFYDFWTTSLNYCK